MGLLQIQHYLLFKLKGRGAGWNDINDILIVKTYESEKQYG